VIGSPKGLKNTLSEGLVSGYRDGAKGSKWVQITAPISPGSSGGPVLTGDGRLVGVATASVIDGQNLNFAVPANEVRNLLSADVKHGRALWKGTSISRARDEAYLGASYALFAQFSADHPELDDDGQDAAFKRYRDSKVESGDQLALLLKGYSEYQEKKYEDAVRTLTLAVRSKSGEYDYLTHFALAEAHYEIEHAWARKNAGFDVQVAAYMDPTVFSRTIAALLDAKRAAPSFVPTLDTLAGCYTWTKQYPDALVAAEFLVQAAPHCAQAYQRRGEVYEKFGRHQSAQQDFKSAVGLNPNNNSARYQLACALAALGQHEESIAHYEDLVVRGFEPVWALYTNMGIELEAVGKYERAVAAFEQVVQLLRRENITVSPDIQERLARCRARLK
jgi:tetratricopeptide (TPR) repeat protein